MAPNPTGTIEVVTPNPTLGQPLQLKAAWEGRISNPLVDCQAFQDGKIVYGQSLGPGEHYRGNEYLAVFDPLGAASDWTDRGGPAHCTARLYYYTSEKGKPVAVLVATVEFEAAG